jgi:TRAP-type mannitol/chloroaromatic compound transport system permease small subunit
MRSLNFILPHWLYWGGLLLYPLLAMVIVRRQARLGVRREVTLPLAYLLLITGGFAGLHRLYLRSLWGFLYIPLFVALLLSNVETRQTRDQVSNTQRSLIEAQFLMERAQKDLADGKDDAADALARAQAAAQQATAGNVRAGADHTQWNRITGGLAALIALLLLIDAFLLPGSTRRCRALEAGEGKDLHEPPTSDMLDGGTGEDPTLRVHSPVTDVIDRVSGFAGEFVCYWSIIAVFVYYYEVLARYVFNSPTNWAHESMFLMFGMQYMLAGAFTLREDGHVRVDVLYLYLSDRTKALIDVTTSVFFFIFTIALFWTGWLFASDAIGVWEVSFTEWAIQYWPIKLTIALGALLITLQGGAKLWKDLIILVEKGS